MPPDLAAQLAAAEDQEDVEIWPDMVPAVRIFFRLGTQWRWTGAGMAGAFRTGLDYAVLPAVAGAVGIEMTPDVLADLAVLESGALKQWGRSRG